MRARRSYTVPNSELQEKDVVVFPDGHEALLTRRVPEDRDTFFKDIRFEADGYRGPLHFALLGMTTIRERTWPPPRYERDEPL